MGYLRKADRFRVFSHIELIGIFNVSASAKEDFLASKQDEKVTTTSPLKLRFGKQKGKF